MGSTPTARAKLEGRRGAGRPIPDPRREMGVCAESWLEVGGASKRRRPAADPDWAPPRIFCAASQLVRASLCKSEDQGAIPWRHSNGGAREQANPAGCEPASDEIDTRASPQICRHRSVVGQRFCKPPTSVRFQTAGTRWPTRSTVGRDALNVAIGVRLPGRLPFTGGRYADASRARHHGGFRSR